MIHRTRVVIDGRKSDLLGETKVTSHRSDGNSREHPLFTISKRSIYIIINITSRSISGVDSNIDYGCLDRWVRCPITRQKNGGVYLSGLVYARAHLRATRRYQQQQGKQHPHRAENDSHLHTLDFYNWLYIGFYSRFRNSISKFYLIE